MDKYKKVEQLQKLKDSGTITEQEFNAEKEKILNTEMKGNKNKKVIGIIILSIIVIIVIVGAIIYTIKNNNTYETIAGTEENKAIENVEEKDKTQIENKDISFENLKNNEEELQKLSDDEKLVAEYFNNDYFFVLNTEEFERFPTIYKDTNIQAEGVITKILKSTDTEYSALVMLGYTDMGEDPRYRYNIEKNENTVIINCKQVVERFLEGDKVSIYGKYNTVETQEVDGKSYTLPTINVTRIQEAWDDRFTEEQIKQVAKYLFGNNIKIAKNNTENEESRQEMVVTLEDQSNINFKQFIMSKGWGNIRYDTMDTSFTDVTKKIHISADFKHFIVTTYDNASNNGYVDYYDKDLNKVWSREFKTQSIIETYSISPFDYTTKILAITIDNDLYLIDMETGENIIEPVLVGTKSRVLIKEDKIILVGTENKDTVMVLDFKGNVLYKHNGNTSMNNIQNVYTQIINGKVIIRLSSYNDNYTAETYKFIVLNEKGELETSTKEINVDVYL